MLAGICPGGRPQGRSLPGFRFRLSRAIPYAKSYRVTRDSAGRWHIAFAAIPAAIPAPGTGEVVGADRGVAVAAALSTGELRRFDTDSLDAQVRRTQRRLCRARPSGAATAAGGSRPGWLACTPAGPTPARTGWRSCPPTWPGAST